MYVAVETARAVGTTRKDEVGDVVSSKQASDV